MKYKRERAILEKQMRLIQLIRKFNLKKFLFIHITLKVIELDKKLLAIDIT